MDENMMPAEEKETPAVDGMPAEGDMAEEKKEEGEETEAPAM